MELKEFINKTLTQIAEGVQEAIDNSEGKGYLVSPTVSGIGKSCNVHFDIAVESEAEGKAGIKVVGGCISKRSTNRISFDVTMTLPTPIRQNSRKKMLNVRFMPMSKQIGILNSSEPFESLCGILTGCITINFYFGIEPKQFAVKTAVSPILIAAHRFFENSFCISSGFVFRQR